jgi:hypothetical protein
MELQRIKVLVVDVVVKVLTVVVVARFDFELMVLEQRIALVVEVVFVVGFVVLFVVVLIVVAVVDTMTTSRQSSELFAVEDQHDFELMEVALQRIITLVVDVVVVFVAVFGFVVFLVFGVIVAVAVVVVAAVGAVAVVVESQLVFDRLMASFDLQLGL